MGRDRRTGGVGKNRGRERGGERGENSGKGGVGERNKGQTERKK